MFVFHLRQRRWTSNEHVFNNRWFQCNEIQMGSQYDQLIDEYLSSSPNIICWNRITSISIFQPCISSDLRVLLSKTTNLRILTLTYLSKPPQSALFNDKTFIDLINDESLCNILTANGLRQLNLIPYSNQSNLINLSYLIIERLPYLEVIEMNGHLQQIEVIEMAFVLINGLSKLSFITLSGLCEIDLIYQKTITLFSSNISSFRMEMATESLNGKTLLIWF